MTRLTIALLVSLLLKLLILFGGLWPAHVAISILLFAGPDIWLLGGILIPNSAWLAPIARRFATEQSEVWLTIDDGPEPATTIRMLDLLDRHSARATFFVIGRKVTQNPELVAEILRRGHTLGNHTQNHPIATFWLAGGKRTAREIDECNAAIMSRGLRHVEYFRPPAGIRTFFLQKVLAERTCIPVGWTGRGREQLAATAEEPLKRLKRHIHPGAILLLHESAKHPNQRVALLSGLLDQLSSRGYRCVIPLPELLCCERPSSAGNN